MSDDLPNKAKELIYLGEKVLLQTYSAMSGNRSANLRARKLTMELREKSKEMRKCLLQLEKEQNNA
tara:strand:+ start:59 stop:256 length:198 start_codon:yes stop_codon:yes gene_type:complete